MRENMNLIDLRRFEFQLDKIIYFNDSEFIFQNIELEEGIYKRYFYIYSLVNKCIKRINKTGIETSEFVIYNNCILNNYIYTNSYKANAEDKETSIYRINLTDGGIDKLYSIKKDICINILSDRYILFSGNNYEIDEYHNDIQKELQGEYDYAILCDSKDRKEYEIADKRVVLGIRDYFIPYTVDEKRYIVFEEAYMEDWELEDMFKKKIAKEKFDMNSYRESINIISLDRFVESVKNQCEVIPFYEVHKTEYTAWTRYFGMDDENIYYRVKDFKTKIEKIYSISKKSFSKRLLKAVKMDYEGFNIHHDIMNKKIYLTKVSDNNSAVVSEIYNNNFKITLDDENESLDGIVDDYVITSFWIEDNNGDNYKTFVKIKNIKNESLNIYQGICVIINDNLVLFR